jgi:hypothetical protein
MDLGPPLGRCIMHQLCQVYMLAGVEGEGTDSIKCALYASLPGPGLDLGSISAMALLHLEGECAEDVY